MPNTVEQNGTITLSATFYNRDGFLSDQDSVSLYIFSYGNRPTGPSDIASAEAGPLTPTNAALGLYEYDYTVPDSAQVGTWYAWWVGTKGATSSYVVLEFNVIGDDTDSTPSTQYTANPKLINNMVYELTLTNVGSLESDTLSFESYFTSEYTPMCTTYQVIAANLVGIVDNLDEDYVNYLIYRSTLMAESLKPLTYCDLSLTQLACQKYVEYSVVLAIASNLFSAPNNLKSKQLGDLRVSYHDQSLQINNLLKEWKDEMNAWEQVLSSGGCVVYKGSAPLGTVQKGICHPDYPEIGRQIREPVGSSREANTKALLQGRTRYQHAYRNIPHIRGVRDWRYDD